MSPRAGGEDAKTGARAPANTRGSMNVHHRTRGGEPGHIAPDGWGLDPNVLYTSSNRLWRTTNGGDSWERLSDNLTRADPMMFDPAPAYRSANGWC